MGSASDRACQATDVQLISFPIRIRRAFWESNDHQHADLLRLTAEWRDAGADPRLLSSATVQFYLGNADDKGSGRPGASSLRFIGTLVRPRRIAKESEGFVVELEFQDYTAFFLRAKLPPAGVPDYSQSLSDAWARICDNTGYLDPGGSSTIISTVSALRDRLIPVGQLAQGDLPSLGSAAAPRFARLGARVPAKPGADAWAVWQQCVGMCGLISFIRKDQCIVTLAQDYYSDRTRPAPRLGPQHPGDERGAKRRPRRQRGRRHELRSALQPDARVVLSSARHLAVQARALLGRARSPTTTRCSPTRAITDQADARRPGSAHLGGAIPPGARGAAVDRGDVLRAR